MFFFYIVSLSLPNSQKRSKTSLTEISVVSRNIKYLVTVIVQTEQQPVICLTHSKEVFSPLRSKNLLLSKASQQKSNTPRKTKHCFTGNFLFCFLFFFLRLCTDLPVPGPQRKHFVFCDFTNYTLNSKIVPTFFHLGEGQKTSQLKHKKFVQNKLYKSFHFPCLS